jgi:hypothetical protein
MIMRVRWGEDKQKVSSIFNQVAHWSNRLVKAFDDLDDKTVLDLNEAFIGAGHRDICEIFGISEHDIHIGFTQAVAFEMERQLEFRDLRLPTRKPPRRLRPREGSTA